LALVVTKGRARHPVTGDVSRPRESLFYEELVAKYVSETLTVDRPMVASSG
jgi:hypothetical protein